jgi:hypothetical protein
MRRTPLNGPGLPYSADQESNFDPEWINALHLVQFVDQLKVANLSSEIYKAHAEVLQEIEGRTRCKQMSFEKDKFTRLLTLRWSNDDEVSQGDFIRPAGKKESLLHDAARTRKAIIGSARKTGDGRSWSPFELFHAIHATGFLIKNKAVAGEWFVLTER